MASTGIDHAPSQYYKDEKIITMNSEKAGYSDSPPRRPSMVGSVGPVYDTTHRKLKPRHIQLIGIGGTIGTALYVQIGKGLMNGGPGSSSSPRANCS
jgi:amino acid transporter